MWCARLVYTVWYIQTNNSGSNKTKQTRKTKAKQNNKTIKRLTQLKISSLMPHVPSFKNVNYQNIVLWHNVL